jgi:hypothetical protein
MRVTTWGGGVLLAAVLLAAAPEASAELAWVGFHGAYYNNFDKGAIGLHARERVDNLLTAGIKGDYIFRTGRTTWAFEADVQYDLPLPSYRVFTWVGAGAGIIRDDLDGPTESDIAPLVSGFAGIGVKEGPFLPFVEVRLTSSEAARWVLYLGLRF